MEVKKFIKKELQGWNKFEIISLCVVFIAIFCCAITLRDNPIAIISAICGILYTIIAGKGKISCYIFGLCGSWCYSWLAFSNALWGNLLLYLCYYIPMQTIGIFKWKKNLQKETNEIIKTRLSLKDRIILSMLCIIGCIAAIIILSYLNDKNPIIDGIATILSIAGMYLTVRRCIEQWIIWIVVNGLSFFMWLDILLSGTKVCATVIMWGVYFVLAIYFYKTWQKELNESKLIVH